MGRIWLAACEVKEWGEYGWLDVKEWREYGRLDVKEWEE
jgi:hypothetical protein